LPLTLNNHHAAHAKTSVTAMLYIQNPSVITSIAVTIVAAFSATPSC
jgi:hypothetical protein